VQRDAVGGEAVPEGEALLHRLGHHDSERHNEHQDHPEHDQGGRHARGEVMALEPLKDRARQ
jgi:hypothetical protein